MTRPAGVAEQVAVPLKVITERARGPGAQVDSTVGREDVDSEFSEVLTKLKSGGERHPEEAATNLPARSPAPVEPRDLQQRARESSVGEKRGEDKKGARAASDSLARSDIEIVDTSLPDAPSQTTDPMVPATVLANPTAVLGSPTAALADPAAALANPAVAVANPPAVASSPAAVSKADAAAVAESLAAILTLTSGQAPAAMAPPISDQPADQAAEINQRAGRGVSSQAIVDAGLEPEMRMAGQVAPAPRGHATGKDEVRSWAPPASLTFSSPPEITKSAMPGVVIAPARNESPKANVLRQETHFPPVAPSSSTMYSRGSVAAVAGGGFSLGSEAKGKESAPPLPVDLAVAQVPADRPAAPSVPAPTGQIAESIAKEVPAFEVVERAGAAPQPAGTKPVLKVLQIQLQPAELGTVTVRMELRETGLELHVEAAKAETAEIIRGDKDTLSNLLRSSGYNVDASSIRVADVDRTAASQQTGQQGTQANMQSSTQSQSGGAERDARAHRGNGGSSGGDAPTQANRADIHETNTSRASGGLYV